MKLAAIIITIVLLISCLTVYGVIINNDSGDEKPAPASMYGRVTDADTGIGLIDEIAVILGTMGYMYEYVTWPTKELDHRGYYRIDDIKPGDYYIWFSRSWVKIDLMDPDYNGDLKGGWIYPEPINITFKPGDRIEMNFSLEFNAWQEYHESVDNLRVRGEYVTVKGYNRGAWFGHDSNLIGKTVSLVVTWENTVTTQADFTIEVMDFYQTTDSNYEIGPQREGLSFKFDEEYYNEKKIEHNGPDWRVYVRSLPSLDIRPIDVTINWTVK